MTDKYLPSSSAIPAPVSVGSVILDPIKWAFEYQQLAMDYIGEPEQVLFMNASRRFTALAKALPTVTREKPDGFVVLGDMD